MANFIHLPKNSLSFKRRQRYYNPWNLKDIIQTYAGRPYEEVVREYQKKRKQK